MNSKWEIIFNDMIAEIEKCIHTSLPEKKQVEHAFKIPLKYWEDIKKILATHAFKNASEEIYFYKNIKPKFTSYIEYLPLVYLGLCYLPGNKEVQPFFWTQESKKLQKFIDKNIDFVNYYKSGSSGQDMQYFLPANYDLANCIVSKIYDMDGEFITSHDHLIAMLLAHEMYNEYVEEKLTVNSKQ